MSKRTMDDELLTPDELADFLKLSRRFTDEARRKYGLPHLKIGNKIRFKRTDVERWLEERKKTGT